MVGLTDDDRQQIERFISRQPWERGPDDLVPDEEE